MGILLQIYNTLPIYLNISVAFWQLMLTSRRCSSSTRWIGEHSGTFCAEPGFLLRYPHWSRPSSSTRKELSRVGGGISLLHHKICLLAPTLFSTCIDWVMGEQMGNSTRRISLGKTRSRILSLLVIYQSLRKHLRSLCIPWKNIVWI